MLVKGKKTSARNLFVYSITGLTLILEQCSNGGMMKPKRMKSITTVVALGALLVAGLTGCTPESDVVSENISKEADSFNVQRKITVLNTRTDKFMFYAEGRCSVERDNGWLLAVCRHSADNYRKHLIGPATDAFPLVEQLAPIDASRYHTLIVMRPEGIIPDIQLRGGQQ